MRKIYVLLIFLVTLTAFTIVRPFPTGFATFSPSSIELLLTKNTFLPNEAVEGDIMLNFLDTIDATSTITLKISDQTKTLPITQILTDLNNEYTTTSSEVDTSNPETTKILEFTSSGTKKLAFVLPKNSIIESLDFSLEGQEYTGILPRSPSIDLTIDDSIDWTYKGGSFAWSSEIISDGLDLTKDTSSLYIQGSDNLYCNLISLPLADKFKISAKYTKELGADIKATILKYNGAASAIKTDLYCTLPATPTEEWSECELQLDNPIENDHLVCIFTTAPTTDQKYYSLTIDDTSPSTGYQCAYTSLQGSGTCTESSDFFIKVYKPLYEQELTASTFLENSVQQEVADYLTNYLTTCETDECTIPFSVSSSSAGAIILKDLKLDYSTTSSFSTSKFYDLGTLKKSTITEINNQDIVDQEIQIPLSLFGLTAPTPLADSESTEIKITLGSATDSQSVTIYKSGLPAEQSIEKAKIIMHNFEKAKPDTLLVLDALDIIPQQELGKLQTYENELSQIETSNLSYAEISQQKSLLNAELKNYLDTLPTYVLVKGKITQEHIPAMEDITDNILEEQHRNEQIKTEIYNIQASSNVQSTAISFWITDYAGVQREKTLVSKTILNPVGNTYIIEKIPKTVATSADDLIISGDYEVIEKDPIIRFKATETTETISYIAPGNVLDQTSDTITLLIPVDLEVTSAIPFSCGDDICTEPLEDAKTCPQDCAKKMPWMFIIILVALIIIVVWYVNFYRGQWSLKKLIEKRKKKREEKILKKKPVKEIKKPEIKKKPKFNFKKLFKKKEPKRVFFKTDADRVNLRNYIRKAYSKNIPRSQISKILLQQGWTQEQIDFAFKNLKSNL